MQTNFAEMAGTDDTMMAGFFLDTHTSRTLNQECCEMIPELGLSPGTSKEASASLVSVAWGCVSQDASAGPMSLGLPNCVAETASTRPMTIYPRMYILGDTVSASAYPHSTTIWNCIARNA